VTPDGHVISDSAMVGVAADLDRNLLNLLIAADLTDEERTDFLIARSPMRSLANRLCVIDVGLSCLGRA
jgi:hypothetical protein